MPATETVRNVRVRPRAALMQQMLWVLVIFLGLEVLLPWMIFFQQGGWQNLVIVGDGLLGFVFLALIRRWVRQDRLDAAGYATLFSLMLNFIIAVSVWAGATLPLALAGVFVILVAGNVVLPRRWQSWGVLIAIFLVLVVLVEIVAPWPRFDTSQVSLLRVAVPVLIAALVVAFGWYAILAVRFSALRTRLLVSFVFVVLLPGLLIAAGTAVFSLQFNEDRARSQLLSVADTKVAQIDTWLEGLTLNLTVIRNLEAYSLRNLLQSDAESVGFRYAYALQLGRLQESIALRQDFDILFLMDAEGTVILSTDVTERFQILNDAIFFQRGLQGLYLDGLRFSTLLGDNAVTVALPILDSDGTPLGVLAGQASVAKLNALVSDGSGLGETGQSYLVDEDYILITEARERAMGTSVSSPAVETVLQDRPLENRTARYLNYAGAPVIGVYRWLPDLGLALLSELEVSEAGRGAVTIISFNLIITFFAVVAAAAVALFIVRGITEPITALATAAQQIAEGELSHVAVSASEDEIGVLAKAFNSMTQQLRDVIGELEARVSERTAALERRSAQLEAAAQVSRQAASIRDVGELLDTIVSRISERFDFYHVSLFLLDDRQEFAVLRASWSREGREVLARGLKLKVGELGIVGSVAASGEPRIALDVTQDDDFLETPELPETRSEISLPLKVRDVVLGVLDVQSDQPAAFSSADTAILQTMADQIALAIENARLLAGAEEQVREIRRLLQVQSREGWASLVQEHPEWRYVYDGNEVSPQPPDAALPFVPQMSLPLLGGVEPIGEIQMTFADRAPAPGDQDLARAVVDQASQALESARLFAQMQDALEETGILYRGGQAVGAADSTAAVLRALVEHLVTPGIDRCILALIKPGSPRDNPVVCVEAAWQAGVEDPPILGTCWSAQQQIPVITRLRERSLAIDDVNTAAELDEESRRVFQEMLKIRALLIVPLTMGEGLLGWLMAESLDEPHTFSEREVRLYRGLADQAALKLQSFRLLEEATRRAEQQQRITAITAQLRATLDMDAILQTVLREIGRSIDVSDMEVRMLGAEAFQRQDEV